jgi:hypothetical protein
VTTGDTGEHRGIKIPTLSHTTRVTSITTTCGNRAITKKYQTVIRCVEIKREFVRSEFRIGRKELGYVPSVPVFTRPRIYPLTMIASDRMRGPTERECHRENVLRRSRCDSFFALDDRVVARATEWLLPKPV